MNKGLHSILVGKITFGKPIALYSIVMRKGRSKISRNEQEERAMNALKIGRKGWRWY